MTIGFFVGVLIAVAGAHTAQAQVAGDALPDAFASICSKPAVPQSNNPVVRDLLTQYRDLTFDFCRVKEDYKDDGFSGMLERQFGTLQDVIVDVFTGRGLHPTLGLIVPESGAAFGLALNNEWHVTETPHIRFTTSVEGRISTEGFWAAGAVSHMQFDWYRVHDTGSFRMPQATVAVRHFDLPELPFFGLGNQTSQHDRSLFELTETEIPILVDFPVAYGLTVSAQANALFAASDPSRGFTSRFSESTAPGIQASTTHIVPGVAVTYRSPDLLYGSTARAERATRRTRRWRAGRSRSTESRRGRHSITASRICPSPRGHSLTCEVSSARAISPSRPTWSSVTRAHTTPCPSICSRRWAAATSTTRTG